MRRGGGRVWTHRGDAGRASGRPVSRISHLEPSLSAPLGYVYVEEETGAWIRDGGNRTRGREMRFDSIFEWVPESLDVGPIFISIYRLAPSTSTTTTQAKNGEERLTGGLVAETSCWDPSCLQILRELSRSVQRVQHKKRSQALGVGSQKMNRADSEKGRQRGEEEAGDKKTE
ncbi:hypothetical protein D9619_009066 [Psilocybe cf. subviscida]|uniref:Uncharacterized protein n=1 Tax=Psilocybe cf. subviscida TaxID=2480587 RepID=A0A8H5FA89_9AGAR|nr:hypothetical protein D9619_009066 [Psilocybe cf. subviscida]